MRGYVENSIPPQPQVPQCKISETEPIVTELHTAFQNLFTIWHFSGQLVGGDQAGAILRRARQNCPGKLSHFKLLKKGSSYPYKNAYHS